MKHEYKFLKDDYSDRKNVLFWEYLDWLDRGSSVLDIGCGTGNSKTQWRGKWTGISVNSTEVKNGPEGIHLMDAHELAFEDNSFDCFIMWDSLEHMVSPYIALSEAKRVIVPGGKGLIFMPGLNWLDHHDHICVYTIAQMVQLFKRVGLRLLDRKDLLYPHDPELYCEGMAVYLVTKDPSYKPSFSGGYLAKRQAVYKEAIGKHYKATGYIHKP